MRSTVQSGRIGEDFAVNLLRKNNYQVLTRNFRSRFGEIDIIAQDQNTLVFVEVKTRWSKKFGSPEEAITPRKLRHLEKTAYYFKLLNPKTPEAMRFDVVAVEIENGTVQNARILKNVSGF